MSPLGEPAGAVLWEPSPERLRRSQLTRYTDWLARERGLRFDCYEALRRWSVTELEAFWGSIWDYFEVRAIVRRGRGAGRPPDAGHGLVSGSEAQLRRARLP